MNQVETLIDSDAFIGLILERDSNHEKADAVFKALKARKVLCATTSLVVIETATVLSHASGQEVAKVFLHDFIEQALFPVVFVGETLYETGLELFKKQTRRGTSVADCVNVVVMQQLEIPTIFSFDKVYPKDFQLATVETLL